MASSLSVAERARLLDNFGTTYGFASAHSADPGATGTLNELTGGSPAYARKAVTWATATSATPSVKALAATFPTFDVPPGSTVAYIGFWTLGTGGTYGGCIDVTDEVYAGQGTYLFSVGPPSISL
jgi:hypothetical protein